MCAYKYIILHSAKCIKYTSLSLYQSSESKANPQKREGGLSFTLFFVSVVGRVCLFESGAPLTIVLLNSAPTFLFTSTLLIGVYLAYSRTRGELFQG